MFYKTGVDIANPKSMWNFLHDHFQYNTMNSWNCQKSIANNVKLYKLQLDGDWTVAMKYLFDESDAGGLQMLINDMIKDFEDKNLGYKVGFNGRSNGYLVLYNDDNYYSILPDFITDYTDYESFKEDMKDYYGSKVIDFKRELRDLTETVRDFDKLCDNLRDLVNEYSMSSFDTDKLAAALEWFDNAYGDDLVCLELQGPYMEGDKVKLNDIEHYSAFMQCFRDCLGEDKNRITGNNGYLWLKES